MPRAVTRAAQDDDTEIRNVLYGQCDANKNKTELAWVRTEPCGHEAQSATSLTVESTMRPAFKRLNAKSDVGTHHLIFRTRV